jgi:hypothetical protein
MQQFEGRAKHLDPQVHRLEKVGKRPEHGFIVVNDVDDWLLAAREGAPSHITHTVADVLRARMLAIGCGYPDGNDFDRLRFDPAFKLACGRLPDTGGDLCSQPTISRWENAPTLREIIRLTYALVDIWCRSYQRPPQANTEVASRLAESFTSVRNLADTTGVSEFASVAVAQRLRVGKPTKAPWMLQVLATLGGAAAAGSVAWFLISPMRERRFG